MQTKNHETIAGVEQDLCNRCGYRGLVLVDLPPLIVGSYFLLGKVMTNQLYSVPVDLLSSQ